MSAWQPMTTAPEKTGRYIVAHRGQIGGHAYYAAPEDAERLRMNAGWNQLPDFGATHWTEGPKTSLAEPMIRFWPDPKIDRCETSRDIALRRLMLVTGHDRIRTRDARVLWLGERGIARWGLSRILR